MPKESSQLLQASEHRETENALIHYITHLWHSFEKNKKLMTKVISNALSTTAQAFNTTANAEEFTKEFGRSNVATATTTAQSVFRNVPGGALLAPGQYIAGILGEIQTHDNIAEPTDEQRRALRDTMIAAYTLTGIYTIVTLSAYLGCYFVFPEVYTEKTAKDSSEYLLISGASTWAVLALGMLGPVVFAYGHWVAAMMSALISRGSSIGASYLLADETKLAITGIGVGNAIGPMLTYIPFEIWMRRQPGLQNLRLSRIGDEEANLSYTRLILEANKKNLWSQTLLSWKIGSQRAAEWVNLWVIALIIGHMNSDNLTATNPSTQLLSILNLFSQGIGIATNLLLKTLVASLHRDDLSLDEKEHHYKKIKSICRNSLIYPGLVYGAIAGTIYFTRSDIVSFFLSGEEAANQRPLAEKLLWINALSLPVDALRLISSGSLNAFNKMVKQNLWSLFWMTAIGIFVPYFATQHQDNDFRVSIIFAARVATILISAIINIKMQIDAIAACNPSIAAPINIGVGTRQAAEVIYRSPKIERSASPSTDSDIVGSPTIWHTPRDRESLSGLEEGLNRSFS